MIPIRCTLLSDGASDRILLPVLHWLLRAHCACPFLQEWADFRQRREPPHTLTEKVRTAVDLYPCELLFVHRDAENESWTARKEEILKAVESVVPADVTVCIIPVRMREAWFLFDVTAIRHAADNPHGMVELELPPLARIEQKPDPKRLLHGLLERASELPRRRLRRFAVQRRVHRLADLIADYSPLRSLPAFRSLEQDLRASLERRGWLAAAE